jgi:hypothetical protein
MSIGVACSTRSVGNAMYKCAVPVSLRRGPLALADRNCATAVSTFLPCGHFFEEGTKSSEWNDGRTKI